MRYAFSSLTHSACVSAGRALPFKSHLLTLRLIRKAEHNSTLRSYNDTFTLAETLLFVVEIKVIIASHALTQHEHDRWNQDVSTQQFPWET